MTGLPEGWRLRADPSLRRFADGTVLAGGRPGRVLTLTDAGAAAVDGLLAGAPVDAGTADLAGRLVTVGMAHPVAPAGRRPVDGRPVDDPSLTVVVPVLDRPGALDRCLAALGRRHPVVVVDDASTDAAAVAAVCGDRGARLVRRDHNGGPGAARTTGLGSIRTDLVAFVDSDCVVGPGWTDGLTWLFADPSVAAVAPRVVPVAAGGTGSTGRTPALHRFLDGHSPLDLGPEAGEVGPGRVVRYVPTAALVVRRDALEAVGGFADGMRVGEDVDLVWRLVDAGWRVRYEPGVTVAHHEPATWPRALARRFRYGTSAGPLSARHPGQVAHVELRPWPTAVAVAALAGRPLAATAGLAGSSVALARRVRPLGVPATQVVRWNALGAGWTVVGLGRAATMLAAPGLAVLACRGRRGAWATAVLVLAPPTVDWVRRRPDLDILRWTVASVADDVAYGAGVWTGCVRSRSFRPLLPAVRWRPEGS